MTGPHTHAHEIDFWLPATPADGDLVRAQLERILRHPLFAHSRRYPALLRYVVEQAIDGTVDHIKERTLGVLVFGRAPTYDANADPVVRVTAGEIRKRLHQYYAEAEHSGELRINLRTGSYVPSFHLSNIELPPAIEAAGAIPDPPLDREVEARQVPLPILLEDDTPAKELPARLRPKPAGRIFQYKRLAVIAIVALLGILSLSGYLAWRPVSPVGQESIAFWKPFVGADAPILIVTPPKASVLDREFSNTSQRTTAASTESLTFMALSLAMANNRGEARSVQLSRLHVRGSDDTDLRDLREGPAILMGAENPWSIRLTQQMPFYLKQSGNGTSEETVSIAGHDSDGKDVLWTTQLPGQGTAEYSDYALIVRYQDQNTGQPVLLLGGLTPTATAAVAESLADTAGVKRLLIHAPSSWVFGSMEAVISVKVVDGEAGVPQVLSTRFW